MLMLPPSVRVFVAVCAVDLRKSFDGLSSLVREVVREDPMTGHLFVFFGRRGDSVKVLWWGPGPGCCGPGGGVARGAELTETQIISPSVMPVTFLGLFWPGKTPRGNDKRCARCFYLSSSSGAGSVPLRESRSLRARVTSRSRRLTGKTRPFSSRGFAQVS